MATTITGTTVAATNFTGSGAALTGMATQYMHVRDEKAQGTDAGSSLAGVNIRVLNTVVSNTISGASLSSNRVTLPAGSYLITGRAPAIRTEDHKGYLYNVTASSLAIAGSTAYNTGSAFYAQNDTFITGIVTISGTTVFEFRHLIMNARASEGLGINTYNSAAGVEVFSELLITRVS
tara:strand:+ start:311 stop:844 length:534 start_codon:yes stop_codon:yes gene_type:complete